MIREALLSLLGIKAATSIGRASTRPAPALADAVHSEAVHSEAVHALNNQTAVALSDFELQARRSGRVTRRLGLGDALKRSIQEVNDDAAKMRDIVGDAFKDM